MDMKEKLQKVFDVIDGRAHPSTLVEILPAPGVVEENVIRLALDRLVAREIERIQGPATNKFRLKVVEGKNETWTDWEPERTQGSVPSKMAQIRRAVPGAAISVERSYE